MRPHGTAAELERRRLSAVDRVRSGYTHQGVADFLGVRRTSVTRWMGPHAQAHSRAGAGSSFLVFPLAYGIRLGDRTVDCATGGDVDPPQVSREVPSAIRQSLVGATPDHAAETDTASPRTERTGNPPLAARGVAADNKSARRWRAHIVLIDESGFLMWPLVRRTLAPQGKTPILRTNLESSKLPFY